MKNKKTDTNIQVKQSIFSLKDRVTYFTLASLFLFFLTNYTLWWFQGKHIPFNFQGSYLHFLDYLIFAALTFVVFIGVTQRLSSLFTIWFAAKPKFVSPPEGLKVAFLTCFVPGKEPIDMLVETLWAMKKVRYPHDTWVLDEGASFEVRKICEKLGVKYFTRFNIPKYNQEKGQFRTKTKAGNHNAWRDLHERDYDVVAQIDMDHIPQSDYFEKTLGYFRDEKVGFVGMPQAYKNTDNWVARGAAEQSYFFHGPMQQGFYGSDMPLLIGTSHIYKTQAMHEIGGYAPTIVEDHLTGMKFYEHGWKAVYVPEILAQGEGPVNWVDYFNQQMRWSFGLFEILFKHTPKIIWKLRWRQKVNYFLAQLYYFTGVAVVLGMILTFIYLVFGIRSTSMDLGEWVIFSLPPLLIAIAIQIYTHKFSINPKKEPIFGFLGMFLNLGANLIYALAFIKFATGQKLKYMVTQKGVTGQKQIVPASTFNLHIVFVVLMAYALIISFLTNHSAFQLRFWALFNILTLAACALSIYKEKIRAYIKLLRLDSEPAKIGIGFVLGVFIFVSLMFTYSRYGSTVLADFNKQVIQDIDEPIAGKLPSPENGVYLGISFYQHNDTDYLDSLQTQLGRKFAILGYYQSWGVNENKFDKNWASSISKNGSIPMITWEPWVPVSGFDRSESLIYQESYKLVNIVNGNYDLYIRKYAQDIKAYKKPIMIRFAHEMNGNWYPWGSTFNHPEDYVLAWRHIHEIFDSIGATNVTWVWSPNEAYEDSLVPFSNQLDLFYPGDDYVDWVGLSAFNWAGTYKHNIWRSPENLYGFTIGKLKQFGKPIIITETASAESKDDPLKKGVWISELSEYIEKNPEIKGVVWFNTKDNGVDWTIGSSEDSRDAFKTSFRSYFLDSVK